MGALGPNCLESIMLTDSLHLSFSSFWIKLSAQCKVMPGRCQSPSKRITSTFWPPTPLQHLISQRVTLPTSPRHLGKPVWDRCHGRKWKACPCFPGTQEHSVIFTSLLVPFPVSPLLPVISFFICLNLCNYLEMLRELFYYFCRTLLFSSALDNQSTQQ